MASRRSWVRIPSAPPTYFFLFNPIAKFSGTLRSFFIPSSSLGGQLAPQNSPISSSLVDSNPIGSPTYLLFFFSAAHLSIAAHLRVGRTFAEYTGRFPKLYFLGNFRVADNSGVTTRAEAPWRGDANSAPANAFGKERGRSRGPSLDIRHRSDGDDLPTRSAARVGWDDPDRAEPHQSRSRRQRHDWF